MKYYEFDRFSRRLTGEKEGKNLPQYATATPPPEPLAGHYVAMGFDGEWVQVEIPQAPEPSAADLAKMRLAELDGKLRRAEEDIIDVLIAKGSAKISDFPGVIQDVYAEKKTKRDVLKG